MSVMRRVVTGAFALLLSFSAAYAQHVQPGASTLTVGQMWLAKSSSGSQVKVIVAKVEPWAYKTAVHVSLSDVPIPAGLPNAGQTMEFAHLPFDGDALAVSLERLIAESAAPNTNFDSGYRQWQSARGGIFTITVEQAVEFVFRAIRENQRRQSPG